MNRTLNHKALLLFLSVCGCASGATPATTTTTLNATGAAPSYSLTATVTASRLPRIAGAVSFTDQTNGSPLGSATLSVPSVTQMFLPPVEYPGQNTCCTNRSQAVGDFNGDGNPDLALANFEDGTVSVLLGNGDGTFSAARAYPARQGVSSVVAADFNLDGKLDLAIVARYFTSLSWDLAFLRGNGDGSFQPPATTSLGILNEYNSVNHLAIAAAADFNGDRVPDLILFSTNTPQPSTVRLLRGAGDGTFLPRIDIQAPPVLEKLIVGDFNGDQKLDLAAATLENYPNTGGLYVSLGLGNGMFAAWDWYQIGGTDSDPGATSPEYAAISVTTGDFNNDGKLDLVALPRRGGPATLLGHGDGTFAAPVYHFSGLSEGGVNAADFDGDGNLDLLAADNGGGSYVLFFGNGNGSFQPAVASLGGPERTVTGRFMVADLNGDGLPDLVGSPWERVTATVMLNQITQTATATLSGVQLIGTGNHAITGAYSGNLSPSSSLPITLAAGRVSTSLALAVNPTTPVTLPQTVTLTAALTPSTAQNLTAGGTVTFFSNSTQLGTPQPVLNGQATLNIALPGGANAVTATYSGDSNFASSSTAAPITVTVLKTANVAFTGLPASAAYGVTFTANTTTNGTTTSTPAVTATGGCSYNPATRQVTMTSGTVNCSLKAAWPSDGVYGEATATSIVTAATATMAVALDVTSSAASPGTVAKLTATLTPQFGGALSRPVTFFDGTTAIGTATVTSGVATLTTPALSQGAHAFKAVYSGDANFQTGTSPAIPLNTVSVQLEAAPDKMKWPGLVGFLVVVKGSAGIPTGDVTIYDGTTKVTTARLIIAGATVGLTLPVLDVGNHSLTAVYEGNNTYAKAGSGPEQVTIQPAQPRIALECTATKFVYGLPVTCTALVTALAPAEGTLVWTVDGVPQSAALVKGIATLTLAKPAAGRHSVTASFATQGNFIAADPKTDTFTIAQADTDTRLTASSTRLDNPGPVTLTATVTSATAGAPASGIVTFYNGRTAIGTAPVNAAGVAALTTGSLSKGNYSFSAGYSGSTPNFEASTSNTVGVMVK